MENPNKEKLKQEMTVKGKKKFITTGSKEMVVTDGGSRKISNHKTMPNSQQ